MISQKGYVIKKSCLSAEDYVLIEKELTVRPIIENSGSFAPPNPAYPVYRESPTKFRVPRFWGIEFLKPPVDKLSSGFPISISFNGKLKTETSQPEATSAVIDALNTKGGGILSLPTGYGKTSSALYVIAQMNVKTIVIVHKEFLMNQWIERIQQFLPQATIGKIQQNKVDIVGKDIVVAMLQSVSMKDYPPGTFDSFGLTVIDEVHHISTRVFSCALLNFATKYMLGLSATPIRKDGLTKVIEWFIGPICFSIERKTKTTSVQFVHFKCDHFKNDPPTTAFGKISIPTLINELCAIDERNDKIVELIQEIYNKGRKIIVLSDRRSHCELLQQRCSTFASSGLYMGGMKQSALDDSEKCDIIFATFSLAQEGLDIPKLDTCFLVSPKTDVVQAVGRVMRETPGKTFDPLIIDFVDKWGSLPGQYRKRKQFYLSSNFTISGEPSKKSSVKDTPISGFQFLPD